MIDKSERNFEEIIEAHLLNNGYKQRHYNDYERELCLIPDDVMDFIIATQPEQWNHVRSINGDNAHANFLTRLAREIDRRGTLDVLRNGIKDSGQKFSLIYFQPVTTLNEDVQRMYRANIFTVVRQLHYSTKNNNSLDVTIFINGIPIITAELKTPFTGQRTAHAVQQYKQDRDPREPVFKFGRCLVHFAVDPDTVEMTTHLNGAKTRFLPFNKGYNNGKGNPQIPNNFATHYLWEEVWQPDSLLNLLEEFIYEIDELDDKGDPTGKRLMIFPRYHQLDAVRRLKVDARRNSSGQHYLIQHSAGSGKTYSIAWLAHQLLTLHTSDNQRVFDTVIVITDRRVLDKQLQQSIAQFEQVAGMVENIDTTSRQLKQALEAGKKIIVTTLQKFPVIASEVEQMSGENFAVIIDEAHSSQSGESVKSLKAVLSIDDDSEDDMELPSEEDRILEVLRSRKQPPNVSMFAFTATPKAKTLELFGTKNKYGQFMPFSLYSMRQAIEEEFILDVLKNYTTFKTYWKLLKAIDDDPKYQGKKAKRLLRRFVDEHSLTIAKRVEIIAEHFHEQVAHQINGQAKAMIVSKSRAQAVRYFLQLRHYLQENDYPYKALVAFSGTVKDGNASHTEASLNGIPESQTTEVFKRNESRFMVVANKLQTGFDQPLLHTMYVDKKLSGVHAVQTLSRLNRTTAGKTSTAVLDFANEAEYIMQSFAPYYEQTILSEATDHNLLYDRETELRAFRVFSDDEVERFAEIYFAPNARQDQVHAPLQPAVDRYLELGDDEQTDFRAKVVDYIRQYAFLSQVLPFEDVDLEKLYQYLRFLLRKLPIDPTSLPYEVLQDVEIEAYRVQQTSSGDISLPTGQGTLEPINLPVGGAVDDDPEETLSQIVEELNTIYGIDVTEKDLLNVKYVRDQALESEAIQKAIDSGQPDDKVKIVFDTFMREAIIAMFDEDFNFSKKMSDNTRFREAVNQWIYEQVRKKAG